MFTVQTTRDEMLKPLRAVTGTVEKSHTIPILSNVLLHGTGGGLRFLATDLEVQVQTIGETAAPQDLRITASAKKLQEILTALPENAAVQLDWADHRLTVKAGKSRFSLQTLPADDFPTMNIGEHVSASFTLEQETLRDMLSQVEYSMAVQDIRYYLNGLLMQVEGSRLNLVATDGHRLSYHGTAINADLPRTEVIVPRKTITELKKLLTQPKESVSVELLDKQVRFQCNGVEIVSKVIDGKFPDYNRVIPLDNNKIFVISRTALLAALERSKILANEKIQGVRLNLSPGSLKISCQNGEQEEAQEELEIAYQGEALETGFNIRFLQDVLKHAAADEIQLAFGTPANAVLVTVPNHADFKYIVMPMRI